MSNGQTAGRMATSLDPASCTPPATCTTIRRPTCGSLGAGLTVIVMGNSASTDALNVAEHAAAFVLPGKQARLGATGPSTTADLVGVYRRKTLPANYKAEDYEVGAGYELGLPFSADVFVSPTHLELRVTRDRLILGASEHYTATNSGGLTIFGGPPGRTTMPFCKGQQTDLTPTGSYHWTVIGRLLSITTVSDKFCGQRAQLVSGTWTRTSKPAA